MTDDLIEHLPHWRPPLLLTPKRREALKLLGISEQEWMFVQGRYEQARRDLTSLRTSIRRVAEITGDKEIIASIPAGDEFAGQPYVEHGWNTLCANLWDWVTAHKNSETR